ncbi:MAG: bifunctional hydroxymethylpyrimidine kinase/phosphomethylpyrimidine kinase [Proteobacteria bacterium]|nr:bifunctional hydroxymethylpyrimidine kinase/phosphomethylpyrimidine kinase [Pseudomonadota bacterium]
MNNSVLSIAGFDGSGGAGIQADLKTFSAFGCYGMTVLTALPVQNTTGVKGCYEIPLQSITEQLQTIFDDIVPHAIKIGMLFKSEIVEIVSNFLSQNAKSIPIVLDPVMVAKSGDSLLLPQAIEALKSRLIPLSTIITPNLPEAKTLTGILATNQKEMETVAEKILTLGSQAVLLKGGHLQGHMACDLYWHSNGIKQWLISPKIQTRNTHGTGCTLSSAIASGLSLNLDLFESCKLAKRYLSQAIEASRDQKIGHGAGPVHHFFHLWPTLDKI